MRRRLLIGLGACALVVPPAGAGAATRPNRALGQGLSRLAVPKRAPRSTARQRTGFYVDTKRTTITDGSGRVLVDLGAASGTSLAALRTRAEGSGLRVTTVNKTYGVLEGFVARNQIKSLASVSGVGTLVAAVKPGTNVGAATSQGVHLSRADAVRAGIDGSGITIGALSDSYDAATLDLFGDPLAIHAAQDVASGDLPGPGNPVNQQPVVVIEDEPQSDTATDEGRAMLQIAHDVAPKSKLCFATAFSGLFGFADNVLALADPAGPCGADVVVDDVIYFDEPMFSDSVLSDAINTVSRQGGHYFSSAGNEGDEKAWQSPVKLVSPTAPANGSNLHLDEVDPTLFDGGLQDMNPGPGVDVAQNVSLGEGGGLFDLQWDDPVDLNGAKLGAPLLSVTGDISTGNEVDSYPFTQGTVGQTVQFVVDGIPSGSTDLILSLIDPSGNTVATVDTGSSPEVLAAKITQPGTYTIEVSTFQGDTGDYTLTARPVLSPSRVSTDFNLLFFDQDGHFLGASADLNPLSGRPSELISIGGIDKVQIAIGRAGTGSFGATRLRNVLFDDVGFTEYVDPLAPAIFGHPTAESAVSVGAYDPFKPFTPEWFTSPGGDLPVVFNSRGNRLPRTSIRRTPSLSAADGGNNTFFSGDTPQDDDTQPNFFGTSAAAPHAAAVGALALQSAGGGKSLSATGLRTLLQQTAFNHDLDPDTASGSANGLTVSATGEQGSERDPFLPGRLNDPTFFRVRYTGAVPLRSILFYGETANPTGRGIAPGDPSAGMVFDTSPFNPLNLLQSGFPFVVGGVEGGLAASDVSASFSDTSLPNLRRGQYRHFELKFKPGTFRSGRSVRFGLDRDEGVTGFALGRGEPGRANEGNGADYLGGAVFLPEDLPVPGGLKFVARRADGSVFTGTVQNTLGHGWDPLDGYGVVNAQAAVDAAAPAAGR